MVAMDTLWRCINYAKSVSGVVFDARVTVMRLRDSRLGCGVMNSAVVDYWGHERRGAHVRLNRDARWP